MELQLALDAVQPVGLNVTAQVNTQQVQEVQAVNEAPHPVQQMDTEIRNPFPVASAQPNFSQLCSDSESPIEDMKLPYNEEVLTVNVLQPSDDREDCPNEVVDLEILNHRIFHDCCRHAYA